MNLILRILRFIFIFFRRRIDKILLLLDHLGVGLQSKRIYRLLSSSDVDKYILKKEHGGVETLFFPKIFKLTNGGEIRKVMSDIEIYEFFNVKFMLNSDFIRFNDKTAFCDKLSRIEMNFMHCGDADYIKHTDDFCILRECKDLVVFESVFHITGCFFHVWTHFLAQYFPKLNFLDHVTKDEKITLVLPNNLDKHICFLIDNYVVQFENVSIVFVDCNRAIVAKKMIYISLDSWLGDIGKSSTMFHIQISDFVNKFILAEAKKITYTVPVTKKRKVFIGRIGKRNIKNYKEVLHYFESIGFTEVFPHLLSFNEKIELFVSADFIAGPLSSGFANIIFCKQKPNVLMLSNPSRHDDLYLTKTAKSLGINLQYFLGSEVKPSNSDSDYLIDMSQLKTCLSTYME